MHITKSMFSWASGYRLALTDILGDLDEAHDLDELRAKILEAVATAADLVARLNEKLQVDEGVDSQDSPKVHLWSGEVVR